MRLPRRILAPAGAFFVLAAAAAGCGGGVGDDAVVKIGDDKISTTMFDHWMVIAATAQQQQNPTAATGKPASVPKPPEFKECVATKLKTAPKPAKGQPKPSASQFKQQCKTEYEGLRDQIVQFLIESAWIQGEASDRGVKVKDADVKKAFDQKRRQQFPEDKPYTDFLKSSGYLQEDLLYQERIRLLGGKLQEKILKGKDKVTEAQIKAYYEKNKQRFGQPERRDLRIVLTKSEAKANEAKAALDSGQSWKAVAAKYSTDPASKANGGVLPGIGKGEQEKSFDEAAFKARKGAITGPVKSQFGYYIFEVTNVTPAKTQSLEEAHDTAKSVLISQNQDKAMKSFLKRWEDKWKPRTECRDGFNKVTKCSNGPKETKTTTAPPGAVEGEQSQPTATTGG